MEKHNGEDCIYIHNLTRNNRVAFKGTIGYFGGGLLMLKPKSKDKNEEGNKNKKKVDLDQLVLYLNSSTFKNNFTFSGRFKIGHRQLSNSQILWSESIFQS